MILGAPGGVAEMSRVLNERFLARPRKPGFVVSNKGGRYALHYHAEQAPNAESRIRLTSEKDAFGVPRASIDLRYSEQDVESALRSHQLLDRALRANNMAHLVYNYPEKELHSRIWETASDGYHQIGGARMGTDPWHSIVDANLSVHGLPNLSVASSAVFPTGGQANSTFLAVAFCHAPRTSPRGYKPRCKPECELRISAESMKTVAFTLPGQDSGSKRPSVLGLGCASMMGRAGRRESLAALNAAYDAGITFYDTARSYGYGECEALLGEFFQGARRDSIVLCTKFGILPGNPGGWKNRIKPLARAVLSVAPQLRGVARKQAAEPVQSWAVFC